MNIDPTGLEWEFNGDNDTWTATEDSDYISHLVDKAGFNDWQEAAGVAGISDKYDTSGNWIGGDSTLKGLSVDAPTYLYSAGFAEVSGMAGLGANDNQLDSFITGSLSMATITNHSTNQVIKAEYFNKSSDGNGLGFGFGMDVGISTFVAKLPRHFTVGQVTESLEGSYTDQLKNFVLGSTHNVSAGRWKGRGLSLGIPKIPKIKFKNLFFGGAQINGVTDQIGSERIVSPIQLQRNFHSAWNEGASGTTARGSGILNGMTSWEYSQLRSTQHAEWEYNRLFNK